MWSLGHLLLSCVSQFVFIQLCVSDSQGGPGIRGSRGDRGEPGLTVKIHCIMFLSMPYEGHPEFGPSTVDDFQKSITCMCYCENLQIHNACASLLFLDRTGLFTR